MEFQEKNVLVFGSGKSGIAAAELLEKQNANLFIYEGNEKQSVAEIKEKSKSFANAKIYVGNLPEDVMDKLDIVVLSPGVPTDLPLVNT
ncbi:MAG: UDP-N-acetylmuramoyl-L-alanine--D-glutamate ligase, partial [Lachnospiraceae bacterium]|nr:UDP-N-acetylmuramoyl-L-alanine--D-glutamate ligase [Lachnospiraceae bacterium]